jgi:hypothetical protein
MDFYSSCPESHPNFTQYLESEGTLPGPFSLVLDETSLRLLAVYFAL